MHAQRQERRWRLYLESDCTEPPDAHKLADVAEDGKPTREADEQLRVSREPMLSRAEIMDPQKQTLRFEWRVAKQRPNLHRMERSDEMTAPKLTK